MFEFACSKMETVNKSVSWLNDFKKGKLPVIIYNDVVEERKAMEKVSNKKSSSVNEVADKLSLE